MQRPLQFFLLLILLSSCSTMHHINIKSDKSAIVQSDGYWTDSTRLAKTKIISDINRQKNGIVKFKISNVDSLGNYMGDIISDNYFSFKYYTDSLVITGNKNLPVKPSFDDRNCCGYSMHIEIDKTIKQVIKKGKRLKIKKKKDKTAWIYWDINHRKDVENRKKKITIIFLD